MIERKIVAQKMKEFQIQEFISQSLHNTGQSHTKVQRTPMGEKIVVYTSRPGLIVGKSGQNIKKLTMTIRKKFELENPQIEISEVEKVNLDAQIVAERIAQSLERFGSARFKGVAHQVMQDVLGAGALGVEVVISGKVPSARAKSWRFNQGYLKKCGDIAVTKVLKAYATAKLKSGVIGIKVRIMPPDIVLPDKLTIVEEAETPAAPADGASTGAQKKEKTEEKKERENNQSAEPKPKKAPRRKKKEKTAATAAQEEPHESPAVEPEAA